MTTIDCPWCDAPLEIELATAVEIVCDGCLVRVELATDPAPALVAAAA
jgi:hypothetical protein